MPHNEEWLKDDLEELRKDNLLRELREYPCAGGVITISDRKFLNFSSNDYLNLANDPTVKATAAKFLDEFGTGSGASRLVTGTLSCHTQLEERLASLKGYPVSLIFGSGYLANLGIIMALMENHDFVFADRLAHASILDGVILSRAKLQRFNHNDPSHLDELLTKAPSTGRRLVITESVFSMDGDIAPLKDIASVTERHNAMLMVDEAHSTGVFGPGGSGLVRELKLESQVNISMATLSKALGSYGGFAACSGTMRDSLVNLARSFIYSTALPPASVGAAVGALDILKAKPDLGTELLARADSFRNLLRAAGLNVGPSASQIIPIIVGESAKALALSQRLRNEGIIAVAIRPPTVPRGTARIRFSVTLAHSKEDLKKAADVIIDSAKHEGAPW